MSVVRVGNMYDQQQSYPGDRRDLSRLRRHIEEAFSNLPPVAPCNVAPAAYPGEMESLMQSFGGIEDWHDIPRCTLEYCCGELPLLSPEAFRFCLPAYLMASLDEVDAPGDLTQFLVFKLVPENPNGDQVLRDQRSCFTDRQEAVVAEYLLRLCQWLKGTPYQMDECCEGIRIWGTNGSGGNVVR